MTVKRKYIGCNQCEAALLFEQECFYADLGRMSFHPREITLLDQKQSHWPNVLGQKTAGYSINNDNIIRISILTSHTKSHVSIPR